MSDEEYLRDGRAPVPVNENISKSMRSNKGKNTKPELVFRKALRDNGMSGYRIHWKIPGKPDVAYPGRKIAVFVNGCFWHRCPYCNLSLPKSNVEFWKNKFDRNVERDGRNTRILEEDGWTVLTFWECEVKKDLPGTVERLRTVWAGKAPVHASADTEEDGL